MNIDSNAEKETSSFSANSPPPKPLIVPLIILTLFTAFGMAVGIGLGYVYSTLNPQRYESTSIVRIEPRNADSDVTIEISDEQLSTQQIQHQYILPTELIVKRCLEMNDLYKINILSGFEKPQAIERVLKNLSMEQNPEEKANFTVSFQSSDPKESQVLLANIVQTYRAYLEEKYRSQSDNAIGVLMQTNREFEHRHKELEEMIRLIRQKESINEDTQLRLETLEREFQQTEKILMKNKENLVNLSIPKERNGFMFTLLQQAGLGKKTGPSWITHLLSGAAVGAFLGGALGAIIALLVRKVLAT